MTDSIEKNPVSARLQSESSVWSQAVPDYETFSRANQIQKLTAVRDAVLAETNAAASEVDEAYRASLGFIESSFDFYEGKKDLGRRIERAFVVPMRSDRQDDEYASESTPFYPLLDPVRFNVNSDIRMRTMYGLPPIILDTYLKSSDDRETGALVLSPMYIDMTRDIRPDRNNYDQKLRLLKTGAYILDKTAHFAHKQLGAKVIGLGAILPKVTDFGRTLQAMPGMEGLVTTTGHGGTVHMIAETVRKVMDETSIESDGKIGVIGGAGSIGWSSTVTSLNYFPDHRIVSFDINQARLGDKIRDFHSGDSIIPADNAADVIRNTNIIITAVTSKIDLDDSAYAGIDLTGKVIIDDSQPGCFDIEQVEARGGKLVWVVGEDASASGFISRDGYYTHGKPYNYGNSSGLYGDKSEFACGQETAVIARSGKYHHAINHEVRPRDARRIGKLFLEYGVRIAPFQAFGKPVVIK